MRKATNLRCKALRYSLVYGMLCWVSFIWRNNIFTFFGTSWLCNAFCMPA